MTRPHSPTVPPEPRWVEFSQVIVYRIPVGDASCYGAFETARKMFDAASAEQRAAWRSGTGKPRDYVLLDEDGDEIE